MFSDGSMYEFNHVESSFVSCCFYRYVVGAQDKAGVKRVSFEVPCTMYTSTSVPCMYFSGSLSFSCGSLLQVDLLKNQKSDKVDVTIHPDELEVMDDVLAAK